MKKLTGLAVIAALFALGAAQTGAEAKTVKLRVKEHHHNNSDHRDNYKISCNTARHMVEDRGFRAVKVKSCVATVFSFWAKRDGHTYVVYVHSRNGFVWLG